MEISRTVIVETLLWAVGITAVIIFCLVMVANWLAYRRLAKLLRGDRPPQEQRLYDQAAQHVTRAMDQILQATLEQFTSTVSHQVQSVRDTDGESK